MLKIGDTVQFTAAVVKRCGYDKPLADLHGTIKSIDGRVVEVGFADRTRWVPAANLERTHP